MATVRNAIEKPPIGIERWAILRARRVSDELYNRRAGDEASRKMPEGV